MSDSEVITKKKLFLNIILWESAETSYVFIYLYVLSTHANLATLPMWPYLAFDSGIKPDVNLKTSAKW